MVLQITHKKVATYPDEPGAEVNRAEWNDFHNITGTIEPTQNNVVTDGTTITGNGTPGNPLVAGSLGVYVPYTGATSNVDLGLHSLKVYNTTLTGYQSGGVSNDALKLVSNSMGAVMAVQNIDPSGYSGIEYIDNAGNDVVFTGYNNGSPGEFRFNNVASGANIKFKLNNTDYLVLSGSGVNVPATFTANNFSGSSSGVNTGDITLTTTGTSGPATLVGQTLNVPQYSGGGGGISGSGTAGYVSKWLSSTSLTDSGLYDNGAGKYGFGTNTPGLVSGSSSTLLEFKGATNPGFALTNTTGNKQYFFYVGSVGSTSFSIFDANAAIDRFTIDTTGKVGVNNTSPTYQLDVGGTIRSSGNLNNQFIAQSTGGGTLDYASFNGINNVGDTGQLFVTGNGYSASAVIGPRATGFYTNGPGGIAVVADSGSIRFAAGGFAEQMRLSTTGQLSHGTTATDGQAYFYANQSLSTSKTNSGISIKNANSGGYANQYWENDSGYFSQHLMTGSTFILSGVPVTSNQAAFITSGINGMIFNTTSAAPISFATNNTIQFTVSSIGTVTASTLSTLVTAPTTTGTTKMVISDQNGLLSFANIPSSGSPGGTSGQIQYNNGGAFGGFGSWDGQQLTSTSTTTGSSGAKNALAINIDSSAQTGTATTTGLKINYTAIASLAGAQNLIDLQRLGTSVFTVNSAGQLTSSNLSGSGNAVLTVNNTGVVAASTSLPVASGGTGQTSYTKGNIIVATGTTALTKLAVGGDTTVLTADSAQASGVKWSVSPVVISTVTAINAKTVANTTLYTVPSGKTLIVTGYVVRCTAASAITVGPSAGLGFPAGTNNVVASQAMAALLTTADVFNWAVSGMSKSVAAGTALSFNLGTASTGTSQTLAVDLIGYLV